MDTRSLPTSAPDPAPSSFTIPTNNGAEERRRVLVGAGLGVASGCAFGSMVIAGKLGLEAGATAGTVVALRSVLGTLVLWSIVALMGLPLGSRKTAIRFLILGALVYGSQTGLFYAALERVPATVAVLITYLYPSIAAIIGLVTRTEKLGLLKAAALATSLIGVALVVSVPDLRLDSFGVLLAGLSAIAMALYVIGLRITASDSHALTSGAIIMSGAALTLLPTSLLLGDVHLSLSATAWFWVLLHGLVLMSLGVATYIGAVARIGPTRTGIADTSGPAASAFLGALLLGERLGPPQIVGATLVVVAAATLPLTSTKRKPLSAREESVE